MCEQCLLFKEILPNPDRLFNFEKVDSVCSRLVLLFLQKRFYTLCFNFKTSWRKEKGFDFIKSRRISLVPRIHESNRLCSFVYEFWTTVRHTCMAFENSFSFILDHRSLNFFFSFHCQVILRRTYMLVVCYLVIFCW